MNLANFNNKLIGIKVAEIIKMSSDPNNIKPEIRKANIRSMTVI